jgi:proteasome lid subunit RPN8/RPN11
MIREIPNADLATVRVLAGVMKEIEQQAVAAAPRECCGLLSGNGAVITMAHPLRNESPKPETRYFAAPEDLLGAMRQMRDADRTLKGIYHSHPRTQAYPSSSDVEMAFYPEAVYFIISLESGVNIRAFRIDKSRIQEVAISIEDVE